MKKKRYQSPTTQEVVLFVEAVMLKDSSITFEGSTQGQGVVVDDGIDQDDDDWF